MCVLREHRRSAHSATSDDPTGGSRAVARNRNGQAAAPSGRVTRRAKSLPLSLIEWDSDFHIRDWGRNVRESCGLDGVSPRSFLDYRKRASETCLTGATRTDEPPGQPRLSASPTHSEIPFKLTNNVSQVTCRIPLRRIPRRFRPSQPKRLLGRNRLLRA